MPRPEALALWRELGAELRERREAAGLTGVQLSREIGWSPGRMSKVESGRLPVSEVAMICIATAPASSPSTCTSTRCGWRSAARR